jgi:hypothetical protein
LQTAMVMDRRPKLVPMKHPLLKCRPFSKDISCTVYIHKVLAQ